MRRTDKQADEERKLQLPLKANLWLVVITGLLVVVGVLQILHATG